MIFSVALLSHDDKGWFSTKRGQKLTSSRPRILCWQNCLRFRKPAQPEVSTLLARLLDPQPGERICDPACGSGSLLIKCAQQVGSSDYAIYGQENNDSTWALAVMNMFLHNINVSQENIQWGDTLKGPALLEGDHLRRYNVVVANPPLL
jgi:methylase of polypeptide subunit release factors